MFMSLSEFCTDQVLEGLKICQLQEIVRCLHSGVFLSIVLMALQSEQSSGHVSEMTAIRRCPLRNVPL